MTAHRLTEDIAVTDVSESNGYDFPKENKGKRVPINSRNVSNYGPKGDVVGIEILDAHHHLKFSGRKPKIEAENLIVA